MAPDETRLSEIGVGESATVKSVRNARRIALRLLELGLLPGTRVTVVRRAPMGDPIELRLRDFSLSIRAEEAALVSVTRLGVGARVPASSRPPSDDAALGIAAHEPGVAPTPTSVAPVASAASAASASTSPSSVGVGVPDSAGAARG